MAQLARLDSSEQTFNLPLTVLVEKYLRDSLSTVTQRFNQTVPSLPMDIFSLHTSNIIIVINIIIHRWHRCD